MARTNSRLAQIIKTGLKSEFSKRTIADVVFGERSEIMVNIKQLAKKDIGATPSGSCQVFMIDYFMLIAGLKWRKNSVFGFSTIISFRPENDFL
jgi:regulator of protease activity HflC (stomatin/prohibitin superfamily)